MTTDVFSLAFIGGVIWLLLEFGGMNFITKFVKRGKYYLWGTVLVGALLVYFIYSEFKKTASDASSTASQVSDFVKNLNPFA